MSPTKEDKTDKTTKADVEEQSVEATPYVEPRDLVVTIDISCRTDDPDVTDDTIAAAAQEQVTLPNTIWIDKPEGGQIAVTVIGGALAPDPPPAP